MSEENPTTDEMVVLARRIAASEDGYIDDFGQCLARIYRRERMVVMGLLGVDAMIAGDDREISEEHPRLMAVRRLMRDRMRGLIAWGERTGRM